jgi:hypothetical protein
MGGRRRNTADNSGSKEMNRLLGRITLELSSHGCHQQKNTTSQLHDHIPTVTTFIFPQKLLEETLEPENERHLAQKTTLPGGFAVPGEP